jgi:N-acetylglutamate synthase-like GNAT family acetyltransferase
MQWTREDYVLTDERERIDADAVHRLLRDTYWACKRSKKAVRLSIDNSLCFGLFHGGKQVGVARVLTDHAANSYLCDVVIAPPYRSRGLGTWFMKSVLDHPVVRKTRVFLITRDAQPFYRKLGFATHPYECMVRAESGT